MVRSRVTPNLDDTPRPNREQLELLTPTERIAFELGDVALRHFTPTAVAYNLVVMGTLIWSCGARRLHVHGLERIAHLDARASLLLVANHRSFFDFFVVSSVIYFRTKLSKRILFPIRSSFFYDHPAGPLVNAAMSGMRMFPPVMRERSKASFNQYTVERCIAELRRPGTVLGIHPEGRRNLGDDPYELLPAQPGCGRLALAVPEAHVIPIFVLGMGNNLGGEFVKNWTRPEESRVDLFFGAPLDLRDLRANAHDSRIEQERVATLRCMDAIRALGDEHRALRGGTSPESLQSSRARGDARA